MLFRNGRAPHLNRLAERQFPGIPPIFGGGGSETPTTTTTTTTTTPRPSPSNPVISKPPASTNEPTVPTSTTPSSTPTVQSTPTETQSTPTETPTPSAGTTPPPANTPANSQSYVYNGPSYSYVYNGDDDVPTSTDANAAANTSPPPTSGHKTVTYIGIAAGCILGAVLIIAGIMFIVRRLNKRREDEALGDVFDRNSFVRDSMAIPEEADESSHPSERNRPRPPTMIDRHMRTANRAVTPPDGSYPGAPDYSNFGPPGGSDNGYYGHNQYNNNGGYDQYGGYNQYGNAYGQQYNGSDGYGNEHYPAPGGFAQYDTPSQSPIGEGFTDTANAPNYLNHQVGDYPSVPAAAAVAPGSPPKDASRSLTRQPSSGAGVAYPNVAELGRGTSVTPFQASQYAEIGKRLDHSNGSAPNDPSQAYARLDRQQGHLGAPQTQNGRPVSAYDAEDAYGGI
ncbi:hypothetical protein AURDEDRAFT_169237 [Auricularia subglabra TFB-10046 SS5]|nr:hypothetical protein AURDEDRAFT_169237 [Auricularia subglabra TFB-10046 SS5]